MGSSREQRDKNRDSTMPGWGGARSLQPGDHATTDYECGYGVGGTLQTVKVTARREERTAQSGVMFQVDPPLRNNPADAWFDADWFAPVKPNVRVDLETTK